MIIIPASLIFYSCMIVPLRAPTDGC